MQKQAMKFFRDYQNKIDECILIGDFDYILSALEEYENVPYSEFDNFCAIVFDIIDSYEHNIKTIEKLEVEQLEKIATSSIVKNYVLENVEYDKDVQEYMTLNDFVTYEFIEGELYKNDYFKQFYISLEHNKVTLLEREEIE